MVLVTSFGRMAKRGHDKRLKSLPHADTWCASALALSVLRHEMVTLVRIHPNRLLLAILSGGTARNRIARRHHESVSQKHMNGDLWDRET